MELNRTIVAAVLVVGGLGILTAGVAMVSVPAALIVGGLSLVALGGLGLDVDGSKTK